jgi:hypothetical protein
LGPSSEVDIPQDAQIIDAAGKTVMPGIIAGLLTRCDESRVLSALLW